MHPSADILEYPCLVEEGRRHAAESPAASLCPAASGIWREGLGERPLGVESGGDWDCEFWFGPVGWRRFFGSVMGLVRGLSLVFFTY